eukprot:gb/GECG01010699.1/.p1 GENE.gb/GECG01010699.1/~~gb/GECG01010699.1/.p1  ORF type:complete len:299 (+),score=36.06 gb/GECG01010699.1/:1-897(+)
MLVICIEGCHGSGKTALCEAFQKLGMTVLDEGFLDMPDYALHPQSLLMETTWVCSWFERLLKKANDLRKKSQLKQSGIENPHDYFANSVFIADRSPFSAVFYGRNGHLLKPVVKEHMREAERDAGIFIRTLHVKVEPELLWSRIQERLQREPHRYRYNENDRQWMETARSFYENFSWDVEIENNEVSIYEVVEQCCKMMIEHLPQYKETLHPIISRSSPCSTESENPPEYSCSPKAEPTHVEDTPQALAEATNTLRTASIDAPNCQEGVESEAQWYTSVSKSLFHEQYVGANEANTGI